MSTSNIIYCELKNSVCIPDVFSFDFLVYIVAHIIYHK